MARSPKTITEETPVSAPEKKGHTFAALIVVSLLLVMALGIAGYFYYQYKNTAQVKQAEEIKKLSDSIGKVMDLPQDETPTLATVTDKEKLAGQAFFQKAENGDKVLIYSQSGKAILYRPSTGKIVDVTTVNTTTSPAESEEVKPEPEAPVEVEKDVVAAPVATRISLLNGSSKIGITNTVEDQLKQAFADIAVVAKEAAKRKDYAKTLIVDITGKNGEIANRVAQAFNWEVGSLPSEETVPADTDILIIVATP